jgi:sarcosine oxidase subunit alpha
LRRSDNLARNNRPTLVGLEPVDPSEVVLNGAILFFPDDEIKGHGRGHVTSNAFSAEVGAHIALGLVQGGKSKIGQEVVAVSPVRNSIIRLKIVDPCFLDAAGERYRI